MSNQYSFLMSSRCGYEQSLLMTSGGAGRKSHVLMTDLSEELAPPYIEWLTMVADGLEPAEIAVRLGIPPEALDTFTRIALRKLLHSSLLPD